MSSNACLRQPPRVPIAIGMGVTRERKRNSAKTDMRIIPLIGFSPHRGEMSEGQRGTLEEVNNNPDRYQV